MSAHAEIAADADTFMSTVFGAELPPEARIGIYTKGETTSFMLSPAAAAREALRRERDVYVNVALLRAGIAKGRGKAEDARALVGLWADVDVNGSPDGHGGVVSERAPDRDAGLELLHAVAEPTIVVNSGYGLQGWWLLDAPFSLDAGARRATIRALSDAWQARLRRAADEIAAGFGLDSTADLARVLRVPGTLNTKGVAPVPVTILDDGGPRYTLETFTDLADWKAAERKPLRVPERLSIGDRHPNLKSLAASLRRRGLRQAEILATLRSVNVERCDDSKPDAELVDLAKWADEQEGDPLPMLDPPPAAATGADPPITTGALTMTAAEVRSHIIRWLWVGRLAFGYMTVATGLEKIGKSVFWCWVIAGLTRGTLDGGPDGPTDVLIVAREDGIEDMWKPRLDLAGADLPRVHFVRFEALGDDWNVRDGIARLAEAATATHARLVLLDAVLEHMPEPSGGENLNSPTFIRRSLRPLGDLARVGDGLAVVMSMHPPKRPGAEFRDMVQNSQAWTAVSRLGLLFAYHPEDAELPDDERRRVVVRGAGNIGRNPGALAYRIEGRAYLHDDGETQDREMAAEVEPSPVGMRDLQRAAMREGQTDTKTGQAVALIRALLRDGDWRDSAEVFAVLDAVGVGAKATVAEARKLVGVEVRKAGFDGGWEWRLKAGPAKTTEPSARARTESVTHRTFDVKKTDPSPRNKGSYEGSAFLTEPLSTEFRSDQGSDGHGPPARAPAREAAVANGSTPDLLAELQARAGDRPFGDVKPEPPDREDGHERRDLT